MICNDLLPALAHFPLCEDTVDGVRIYTDCLYPSADPVFVYVVKLHIGYRVSDGGGALRAALVHGRSLDGFIDRASKHHAVQVKGGTLVAEPKTEDWLRAAIVAVSNASAMAARLAVEADLARDENVLKANIFEQLKLAVPESKIGTNYQYKGRSGHIWKIDYAVTAERLVLVKSVVQNGNSINSNYATFGDIGDDDTVRKFSVYREPLAQDSESLLRQVTSLAPISSLNQLVGQQAFRSRLN